MARKTEADIASVREAELAMPSEKQELKRLFEGELVDLLNMAVFSVERTSMNRFQEWRANY